MFLIVNRYGSNDVLYAPNVIFRAMRMREFVYGSPTVLYFYLPLFNFNIYIYN